jgi:hypothetical protein
MTHSITIDWAASPPPVSGYNVYRGSALGNEGPVALNAPTPIVATTYTDNTVVAGQTYSYQVYAVLNGVQSPTGIQVLSTPVPFAASPASLTPANPNALNSFSVLGATTVTNTVTASTTSGDVGVSPGTAITNFGAPASVGGVLHSNDYVAAAAQASALAVYTAGQALPGATTIGADIGGTTLFPGLYNNASSLAVTGTLVLDAQGNPNAVWIFQIGSTLTTASTNSNIQLMGGANAGNVFWLVGSSATLGTYTNFKGHLIANVSVTINTGAKAVGTFVALTGAVTLDNNEIYFSPMATSLPNTPPAPPTAPTGLVIFSEV